MSLSSFEDVLKNYQKRMSAPDWRVGAFGAPQAPPVETPALPVLPPSVGVNLGVGMGRAGPEDYPSMKPFGAEYGLAPELADSLADNNNPFIKLVHGDSIAEMPLTNPMKPSQDHHVEIVTAEIAPRVTGGDDVDNDGMTASREGGHEQVSKTIPEMLRELSREQILHLQRLVSECSTESEKASTIYHYIGSFRNAAVASLATSHASDDAKRTATGEETDSASLQRDPCRSSTYMPRQEMESNIRNLLAEVKRLEGYIRIMRTDEQLILDQLHFLKEILGVDDNEVTYTMSRLAPLDADDAQAQADEEDGTGEKSEDEDAPQAEEESAGPVAEQVAREEPLQALSQTSEDRFQQLLNNLIGAMKND